MHPAHTPFLGWFPNRLPGLLLALATLPAFSAPVVEFDFQARQDLLGWQAAHHLAPPAFSTNGLSLTSQGDDPYLISPVFDLPDTEDLVVRIHLRTEVPGPLQLFHHPDGQPAMEAASQHFVTRLHYWGETCLPLPASGRSWRLRLDLPPGGGLTEIRRITVERPGLEGVTRVTATGSQIEITVRGLLENTDIVALAPTDPLHDIARTRPVHRGRFPGETVLRIPRFHFVDGDRHDRLYHAFVARRTLPQPLNHETIGLPRHVTGFDGLHAAQPAPQEPAGKKGLQVQMLDDALALGIQHAALNVNLAALVDLRGKPESYRWPVDGRTWFFDRAAVDALPVKPLSDAGIAVSLIMLAYQSGKPELDRLLLHPGHQADAPNRLAAFNTVTEEGFRLYRACWEFLADRFSRPDAAHGRVVNYIVGNEVTAHWHWANQGEVPASLFVRDYLRAVRAAHTAVRTASASARVYLSFDHHWNLVYQDNPLRAIAGRDLLERFNNLARMEGNFEWHLAYHPYPADLFNPRAWMDPTATDTPDTPRITFRNLPVLTRHLEQPRLLWQDQPRRILLSEQGFHSDGTPEGEALQAAAYAYAWVRADALPGIEAFILHRHVDHGHEGGLNLGLWRRVPDSVATPLSKKPIYEVFKMAGTPGWGEASAFALPLIGIESWAEIRP